MRLSQHIFKAAVAFITLGGPAQALGPVCSKVEHRGAAYTVCAVDPAKADIRLFLTNASGETYGGFDKLASNVAARGGALVFAMNGGMYHPDYRPVGLYVEDGKEMSPLNRRSGKGNFTLKPNGVFWLKGGQAGVTETGRFQAMAVKPDFATQSGPMLVIDGKIHPKIHADGTSEKTRNGVGLCDDGALKFAISEDYVTFHAFATLFSETLKCRNALFLDGSISGIYAPSLKRNDGWKPYGPLIGIVEGLKR